MKTCPRCETKVTFWGRDLLTGICNNCRAKEIAEKDRLIEQEYAARQNALDEETRREQAAAMQRHLDEQLAEQKHTASLPPCPDCGAALVEIILFCRGANDSELHYYTDAHASRSFFSGQLTEKGSVRTTICTVCHRIYLHGVPLRSW